MPRRPSLRYTNKLKPTVGRHIVNNVQSMTGAADDETQSNFFNNFDLLSHLPPTLVEQLSFKAAT